MPPLLLHRALVQATQASELSVDVSQCDDGSDAGTPRSTMALASDDDEHCCRFCFDVGSETEQLIAPCRCCGTARYVHASCLDRWRCSARSERAFSECLECLATYQLRLAAGHGGSVSLWRGRILDFCLRDFVPVYLLMQCTFALVGFLVSLLDSRRVLYGRVGAPLCRLPYGTGIAQPDRDEEQAAADAAAAHRSCAQEFYFVCGFLVTIATALLCFGIALAAQRRRGRDGGKPQRSASGTKLLGADAAALPAARAPLTRRELFSSALLVASGFLVGGLTLAILVATALHLRVLQLHCLALQRWRLVRTYAVVDHAATPALLHATRQGEQPYLPPAHRSYLRALGFLPAPAR